jgi:hypothetical protein
MWAALQMKGQMFQDQYTHEIPKQSKIHGERISLTFRQHDPEREKEMLLKLEAKEQAGGKRKREM